MKIKIELTFNVDDEAKLRRLGTDAIRQHGGGITPDGTLSQLAVELLLHSNPDIKGYLDYGLELMDSVTTDLPYSDESTP